MIGSCALTCCACCAPISTSCCCEMPHAADIPPKAAIAAPATNRLIVSILSDCSVRSSQRQNIFPMKLLTVARDLRRRKARERQHLFVAEGVRAVDELLRSSLKVSGVLIGPQFEDQSRAAAIHDLIAKRSVPEQRVDFREFASAAETDSPQGILAIAEAPGWVLSDIELPAKVRILVLDGLQDPGNVGTIIRTAEALGVTATYALPGTVDLWNPKVVRSGMGSHFRHPCLFGTWDELDTFRASRGGGFSVW